MLAKIILFFNTYYLCIHVFLNNPSLFTSYPMTSNSYIVVYHLLTLQKSIHLLSWGLSTLLSSTPLYMPTMQENAQLP